jgi:hypothetical protein
MDRFFVGPAGDALGALSFWNDGFFVVLKA